MFSPNKKIKFMRTNHHPKDGAPFQTARSIIQSAFLVCLCAGLAGCATPDTAIISQPPEALIAIDGANVGKTPLRHKFDFSQTRTSVVTASKEGYIDEQLVLDKKSAAIHDGQLSIFLNEDEAYKVTATSDAANNWLRVQVDPSLAPDVVWQKLVDSVTGRYPSLEMIDAASGYMRSVYTIKKFKGPRGEYEIRTRFICSISSKTPLVYKIKIESEMSDGQQDWNPYDRVFKEDAQLIEELQGRLGIK